MNIEQLAEQTRLKSKSALFALLGLMLSPLSAVHALSPPPDSVHFSLPLDYEQWRRDHPRPAGKRLADLNRGEPRTVRTIYFLPNDRPYDEALVASIKRAIKQSQAFFGEQMEAHGYGYMTFRFETDAQGEPLVHRVDGQHPESHYDWGEDSLARHGYPHRREIEQVFDLEENIYVIYRDFSNPKANGSATGFRWTKNRGDADLPPWGANWNTLSHELAHAFGLPHDFRDGAYILSYGGPSQFPDAEGRDRISACAAEFLSIHPYFNSAIPIKESSLPTVELISPLTGKNIKQGSDYWTQGNYPAGLESMSLQFEVSDTDGLHQVLLNTYPNNSGGLRECRALDGEREAVIAFDYDGSSMAAHPEEAVTSLSDSLHRITLIVVDTVGDMTRARFQLTKTVPSEGFYTLTKVAGDEQQGSAGTALAEPLVVSVLDQYGSAFAGVIVTFWVTAGGGTLSATTAITDAFGRARSTLTLGSEPGPNAVAATVAGLTSVTFTATATDQTPHSLTKVSGEGQEGTVSAPLAKPFVVSVLDQNGSAFAGAVVTFSVTAGGGTLSSATATTDANGRARSTLTLGSEPGPNTVAATVAGLEPVTFTATATDQTPHSLTKVSGEGQEGPASTQLAAPLVVAVLDQEGAALAGVVVSFAVTAGGGGLSSATDANACTVFSFTSSATATTDANGQAATRLTLGSDPRPNTVTATVEGLESVTFTATASEQAIPHRLTKVCGDDQEGTVGAPLTEPLVVSVSDEDGAAIAGVIVSFAVTAGGGTLSSATATTDANGRAATRLTLGSDPGTNRVMATVEGLSSVTFTATGQEDPLVSLFDTFLGGGKRVALPDRTQLLQNAPNPFNSETVLSYFLLEPGPVRLEVFALSGQRIAVLHQGMQQAGYHRLHWDGRDDAGHSVASGAYLYRLVTSEDILTRKLILLR